MDLFIDDPWNSRRRLLCDGYSSSFSCGKFFFQFEDPIVRYGLNLGSSRSEFTACWASITYWVWNIENTSWTYYLLIIYRWKFMLVLDRYKRDSCSLFLYPQKLPLPPIPRPPRPASALVITSRHWRCDRGLYYRRLQVSSPVVANRLGEEQLTHAFHRLAS